MDPFSWAMLIMSALQTVNAMTTENTQDTETPADAPGGPNPADITPVMGAGATGAAAGAIGNTLSGIPDSSGASQAAATAAESTKPTPVQTAPAVPPPPDQNPPPAEKPAEAPAAGPSIGETLMAAPEALAAVANLLGMNASNTRTQTPAPAAGGSAGGVVGQFGRPMGQGGMNIGQLLAALPGIR